MNTTKDATHRHRHKYAYTEIMYLHTVIKAKDAKGSLGAKYLHLKQRAPHAFIHHTIPGLRMQPLSKHIIEMASPPGFKTYNPRYNGVM